MERLENAINLIDAAINEIDLAIDKNKPMLSAAITEQTQKLISIRADLFKLNGIIDELKGE